MVVVFRWHIIFLRAISKHASLSLSFSLSAFNVCCLAIVLLNGSKRANGNANDCLDIMSCSIVWCLAQIIHPQNPIYTNTRSRFAFSILLVQHIIVDVVHVSYTLIAHRNISIYFDNSIHANISVQHLLESLFFLFDLLIFAFGKRSAIYYYQIII